MLDVNGTEVDSIYFDGTALDKVVVNGSVVWQRSDYEIETGTYQFLDVDALSVAGYEYVDMNDGLQGADYRADKFVAGGYLENNEGTVVPVLYKNDEESYYGEVDTQEAFFYVGQEYNSRLGGTYDKWRKIEISTDSNQFTWTSTCEQYIYTYTSYGDSLVSNNRFIDGIWL